VLALLLQAPKPRLRNNAAAKKAPDRGTRMPNLRESSSQMIVFSSVRPSLPDGFTRVPVAAGCRLTALF
jgi:hypothetical protein